MRRRPPRADPRGARGNARVPREGRQFWKGYLRLSLVTCPVAMTPAASDDEKVRFHILNRATGTRVVGRYFDSVTGEPVEEDDLARGYARGENDVVVLEEDELEAARLESLRTIDIEAFAPADSIDAVWRQTAYYLTPNDPVGVEAYCVIRDAMRAEKMAALSRLVLQRRERAVALEAVGDGIVLWTLRYQEEVHDASDYLHGAAHPQKRDPELARLVAKLIDERRKPWSEDMVEDPVQSRLLELIAEKRKGARSRRPPKPEGDGPAPDNVISIMDALRKSVASGRSRDGRRPKS
jgi:DNA end-binding protein Ku